MTAMAGTLVHETRRKTCTATSKASKATTAGSRSQTIYNLTCNLLIISAVLGDASEYAKTNKGEAAGRYLGEQATRYERSGVLGEHAACPIEVLASMPGHQISPRLAANASSGNDVPARPEFFRSHSSIIQRLANGMVRKILPVKEGETELETKRRVLKEAEFTGMFSLYRHFPRVLAVDVDERAIYLEDSGKPLQRHNVPCDWRKQIYAILHVLRVHEVYHNDWLGLGWPDTPNFTERAGILYLIDFTWATIGRDSYPFMNPSDNTVARAPDMWAMFETTRTLHEERRLRYQHALDRHILQRHAAAAAARAQARARSGARVQVVRLIDRVGQRIVGAALEGSELSASDVAAESLRLFITVSEVHPWCMAHCADCVVLVTLSLNTQQQQQQQQWSTCESELGADGVSFSLVTSLWDLEVGRYTLTASFSTSLAALEAGSFACVCARLGACMLPVALLVFVPVCVFVSVL